MTFSLEFLPSALREWRKLGSTIQAQFKEKLRERLNNPRIVGSALHGMPNCYKIKLRAAGYRLVYRVDDDRVTVVVIAVGKRENNAAYEAAKRR